MPRRAKTPKWLNAARESGRTGGDWLLRALGRSGALPASEIEGALAAGRVRIDGKVATKPFTPVTESSRVTVDGVVVPLARVTRVLMLHKPPGVVAEGGRDKRPTVVDVLLPLLTEEQRRFHWLAVGRLDVDTTGLLFFTNDERFVQHATSPESHLPKRYLATVHEKATDAMLQPLRDGVTLDDGPARPASARLRSAGLVELTITEGRNHQVKRMLALVGLPVLKLHREAVGGLVVDVDEGAMRELGGDEIERLKTTAGSSLSGFTR
ncbi:MAG: rRNA pseudouridine synthase [Myxococcaceae bacterium]|nr:rRNA pseudouridine synthase [Myxococcaceae bacterium]